MNQNERHTLNGGEYVYRTTDEAIKALTTRYADQTLRFPIMRDNVSAAEYVKANLRFARRYFNPDHNDTRALDALKG